MNKHLTSHMYYNSPIESDDNCGTCNGANCDTCKTVYTVEGFDNEIFCQIGDAEAAEVSLVELISLKEGSYFAGPAFVVKDGELYTEVYVRDVPLECKTNMVFVLCNKNSPIYDTKLSEISERYSRYNTCICIDKMEITDGSPCSKYGCCDTSCYHEMKYGTRTEKKWYM